MLFILFLKHLTYFIPFLRVFSFLLQKQSNFSIFLIRPGERLGTVSVSISNVTVFVSFSNVAVSF